MSYVNDNHIGLILVALTKNSQERGWARPGCGFGRMVRSQGVPIPSPGVPSLSMFKKSHT